MKPVAIAPDIFWIGINDRTTDLFEGLWPVKKEGITYNTYLINDSKKVIIDMAKEFESTAFLEQIQHLVKLSEVDYVIINHMEPDHSGAVKTLLAEAPQVKLVCSKKAARMLQSYYGISENVQIVEDGETLELGKHTLKFFSTPFVHWPETMMTYETTTGTLFSCDGFGGYGAFDGNIFDENCTNLDFYKAEALRYYVNIVASVSIPVSKAIAKLSEVQVNMVAPSHGLIWRKNPQEIIKLYSDWSALQTTPGKPAVTLLYATMYGNTEKMMNMVAQGIASENVPVEIFNVQHTHVSYILPALWTNRAVAVGAPTYEKVLFPMMANVIDMVTIKRITEKDCVFFGSYGWAGTAKREFLEKVEPLNWRVFEAMDFEGSAGEAGFEKLTDLGKRFARHIQQ